MVHKDRLVSYLSVARRSQPGIIAENNMGLFMAKYNKMCLMFGSVSVGC